jgi:hypothetical protein
VFLLQKGIRELPTGKKRRSLFSLIKQKLFTEIKL